MFINLVLNNYDFRQLRYIRQLRSTAKPIQNGKEIVTGEDSDLIRYARSVTKLTLQIGDFSLEIHFVYIQEFK